jgi:surface polysaccharide O-acyltransferase-like enzyme
MTANSAGRITSIDLFRIWAIIAVVAIHTVPFASLQNLGTAFTAAVGMLDLLLRFAVPFFFITSGYFFGKSILRGEGSLHALLRHIRPLAVMFMAWSLVYAFAVDWVQVDWTTGVLGTVQAHFLRTMRQVLHHPLRFMIYGTMPHLWFLPALIYSLTLITAFVLCRTERLIVLAGLGLYILGLSGGAYVHTSFGLHTPASAVGTLLFAFIFVAAGFQLAFFENVSVKFALVLVLAGYALLVIEATLLWDLFRIGVSKASNHYLFGELPYGVGVFLLARSTRSFGPERWVRFLASLTPGIYLAHLLFALPLRSLMPVLLWPLSVVFVYGLSAALVAWLSHYALTSPLVHTRPLPKPTI